MEGKGEGKGEEEGEGKGEGEGEGGRVTLCYVQADAVAQALAPGGAVGGRFGDDTAAIAHTHTNAGESEGVPARPAVSFDFSRLEISPEEGAALNAWYDTLTQIAPPKASPPADGEGKMKGKGEGEGEGEGGRGAAHAAERLYAEVSVLERDGLAHLRQSDAKLGLRMGALVKEAASQRAKISELSATLSRCAAKADLIGREASAREAAALRLTTLCSHVGDMLSERHERLSEGEKVLRDEVRDLGDVVQGLARGIATVKARAAAVRLGGVGGTTAAAAYIQQLPRVRGVLEEDARTVQGNIRAVTALVDAVNTM